MPSLKEIFLEDSVIAFDRNHRKTINFNIGRYNVAAQRGKLRYKNIELAKQRASYIKSMAVANLAGYLQQFEKNALKNGIEVVWARNSDEAIAEMEKIFKETQAKTLVKSKSMISEEIELNEHAEKAGVEPVETDLGEFIVQVAGEKPYHILTPAMHKSKEDVAKLFNEKFGTPPNSTPEELTRYVREKLRKTFISAEIGVTGANFLVADAGGIILTENEGNGLMSTAFPKTHIVISGIEKILPSVQDLPLFLPLLAALGTGQQVTVYNSLFTGPKKEGEANGPERMVVILIDNNRSEIAQDKEMSQSLKCIRCGACLNACPIYRNVGGYTYNTTYSGPIGSVISPWFKGFDEYNHLSHASSLCGACTEVCPVKIPLHYLLLLNRKRSVEQGRRNWTWDAGMKGFRFVFHNRKLLDLVNGNLKNQALKLNRNVLGHQKELPPFAEKSFSKMWKSKLNK